MAFAREVKRRYRLGVEVFTDVESANWHDPFPFEQTSPIVHVDRVDEDGDDVDMYVEEEIEGLVEEFDGEFIGT